MAHQKGKNQSLCSLPRGVALVSAGKRETHARKYLQRRRQNCGKLRGGGEGKLETPEKKYRRTGWGNRTSGGEGSLSLSLFPSFSDNQSVCQIAERTIKGAARGGQTEPRAEGAGRGEGREREISVVPDGRLVKVEFVREGMRLPGPQRLRGLALRVATQD